MTLIYHREGDGGGMGMVIELTVAGLRDIYLYCHNSQNNPMKLLVSPLYR